MNLLPNCLANQRAQEAGAGEAVFIRDGVVLEATASSLLGVFNGTIQTAPKSNYILPSITRDVVLDLCREADIQVSEMPILEHELIAAEELFLAGTTLEVMPVIAVNGRPVGDGRPGPMHRRLYDLFRRRVISG